MAFHKDFSFWIEGEMVAYRTTRPVRIVSFLGRAHSQETFHALAGPLVLNFQALDTRQPTREHHLGPGVDPREPEEGRGSVREEFNHVPCRIDLIAPGQATVVASWTTQAGWNENEMQRFQHQVGVPGSPPGIWTFRFTSLAGNTAAVNATINYTFGRAPLQTTAVQRFLIDHVYKMILEALTPSARLDRNFAYVSFGRELEEYFTHTGQPVPAALREQKIKLPGGVEASGSLLSFKIEASHGEIFLEAMHERWQKRKDELEQELVGAPNKPLIQWQIDQNEEWKNKWEERVKNNFGVIYAKLMCTDIAFEKELINFGYGTWEINGDIEELFVDLYLALDPALERCHAMALTTANLSTGVLDGAAIEVAQQLGLIPDLNKAIEVDLPATIEAASKHICKYLAEAMSKLCAMDAVFMKLTADDSAWTVQYTRVPKEGPAVIAVRPGPGQHGLLAGRAGFGGAVRDPGPIQPPPQIGKMPGEFIVGARSNETLEQTLGRLDKIQNIVVVMMENRSFDHMLGYRWKSRPEVEGLRGTEKNRITTRDVRVMAANAGVIEPIVTRILHSPNHGYESVMKQIHEGAMSGFATEYEKRYGSAFAEQVMCYYTGEELKNYDTLANEYMICDHWFAAHPGGTWPNRWVTLCGSTHTLANPHLDDPTIGFKAESNIFDLLTSHDIRWRYFESDLSIMRTFARYRLDFTHVVPLKNAYEPDKGFFEMAAKGELPPVVFVEPNFSDTPPLSTSNDDLAPVDLRRGQDFIADIYNALITSPQWPGTLFVITYDEHGGFYDHVPPPGTRLGPPQFFVNGQGTFPPICSEPDSPRHLGVRVPAFVISPYVNAGTVCKEIFDHTTIIKTILLLHRRKLEENAFRQFGQRVCQAGHLGLALNRDEARQDRPSQLPHLYPRYNGPPDAARGSIQRPSDPDSDDFHESLRKPFLPRPPLVRRKRGLRFI